MKKYLSTTRANYRHSTIKRFKQSIAFLVGLLLVAWLFPRVISLIAYVVLFPVEKVSVWYTESESVLPKYLRSRSALIAEIESLKKNLANQTGTQLSIRRLLEENMQLRAMTPLNSSIERIPARVIAQPTSLAYDLIQIDKGSSSGIEVGSPVYLGLDTVIGAVVHVLPTYSFVELVTSPGFESTSYIVGPNIFADLEGFGGGIARVKVAQGINLREGNLVLLPSLGGGVYGEIVSVENSATQPEQYGYVSPPVSLHSLLYVSVSPGVPKLNSIEVISEEVRKSVQDYFQIENASTTLEELDTSTTTEESV